jgi:o-succinylbenzoate---CoA ligase
MMSSQGRDLIALALPPRDVPSALQEIWSQGGAVLPLPPDLPEPEMERVLARMRPATLVRAGRTQALDAPRPVGPATDLVVLTSGSTGRPKGVEIARPALLSGARLTTRRLGCLPGDRWLLCVPITKIAGLSVLARSEVLGSEPVILDRFDLGAVAAATDCRYVSLVPTMLHRLLEEGMDLKHFEAILLGGAPCPPKLLQRARDAGVRIFLTYGMTETCGGVVYNGIPLDEVEVKTDDDGVIHLRTPSVMHGYRADEELTRAVLVDGWYRTGDLGRWDGHTLEVLGREDDAIVTGGEKVFPLEIERVLLSHPAVTRAAVRSEPDDEWGQRVVATVSGDVDEQSLREFLKQRLTRYKVPARIVLEEEQT